MEKVLLWWSLIAVLVIGMVEAAVTDRRHFATFLLNLQTQLDAVSDNLDRFIENSFILDGDLDSDMGDSSGTRTAICDVKKSSTYSGPHNVKGTIKFRQEGNNPIELDVDLTGFAKCRAGTPPHPDCLYHGWHVHQFGVPDSKDCGGTGGHYNPEMNLHGGPGSAADNRHIGDFGNLVQTQDGRVCFQTTDSVASLFGDNSIAGRAIVIHADQDDLGQGGNPGSEASGNAGPRIACCTIEITEG